MRFIEVFLLSISGSLPRRPDLWRVISNPCRVIFFEDFSGSLVLQQRLFTNEFDVNKVLLEYKLKSM